MQKKTRLVWVRGDNEWKQAPLVPMSRLKNKGKRNYERRYGGLRLK